MSHSEKGVNMKPNILELIDLEKVNGLLEGFQKTTGFVTAILDLEGNILSKSGWRQMCTEFHRVHPESSKKCIISDTTLANKMDSGEKIHFYKCLNGLIDVAVPIIIKGEHIANLFSGQFLLEEPDVSFFAKQADEFGFDKNEYLQALEKVPVVSKEEVQSAMDFLLNVTLIISDLAFQKLEQTESNKALKDSEERYLAFINASNDMIFLKDEQFRYIVANNAMATFFGMEKEEMIGKTDLELANKDKIFPCISSDKKALEASAAFTIEEILGNRRCETTKFPVNLDNNQKGIGGIIRDITDRYKSEAALRESEERFTLAMKASNDGLFDWNLETNQIYYSPGWKRMLGYEDHELPNDFSVWETTTEPEDVKKSWKLFHELILKQTERFVLEFRMKHKDGHWVDILSRAEAIFDNNGKAFRIVGTHTDISEHKKAEQEIIKAKERAEESDRLKSAFLANMSHEIRTPMNGILGFADLLKNPELTGNQQQEYIQIIEKSGIRMLNIINDIVDISKIEAGLMKLDIKESNINEQIEYLYTFFKPEVEAKGIKLTFNNTLPANEAIIKADREKLYAILTNLVKNAIKYTEKGSIEFGYDLINDSKEKESGRTSKLRFYVKDTGIGIPRDRQDAIFERFIQADISDKMAKQGAGLGLSISKAYAEMLGGRIWVESDEKTGSEFYIELPYNIEPTKEMVDQQDLFSDDYDNPRMLKILIAEDDKVSEMLLNIEVKSFCREIVKARTGFEAVETFRNNPDTDLILMDIRMPEMDGYEATRQIRGFNKEVVIIAQTAYGLSGDREKAIKSGCNDYIAKPIYKADLLAMVKMHVRK
jgi:hypothetical protein